MSKNAWIELGSSSQVEFCLEEVTKKEKLCANDSSVGNERSGTVFVPKVFSSNDGKF